MGMRDESWCNGCGTSVPYTEDDQAYCGECANDYAQQTPQKLIKLIEYIKIHLISLEQDLAKLSNEMELLDMNSKDFTELDFEYNNISGQTIAAAHILSVASDILKETKEN